MKPELYFGKPQKKFKSDVLVAYERGRQEAFDDCIDAIKALKQFNDVINGDWSCCHEILKELDRMKMVKQMPIDILENSNNSQN